MAKVIFVKKARKNYKEYGIKKGEPYYWWKFRFGGKHFSKTMPKPSQLTQSDFLSRQLELQERLDGIDTGLSLEEMESEVQSIIDEIRSLGEEQSDKVSNMPDSLQQGSTGELLQGRADECESWAGELEGIDFSAPEKPEELDERKEEVINEIQGCTYNGE